MKQQFLLGLALVVAGCADPPAPSAPAAKQAAAKTPKDGLANLTDNDCRAWADHFAGRLREASERRIDECDKLAGSRLDADDHDLTAADDEAKRLHGLVLEQCSQQVGSAYSVADAACYMHAKKMEDWTSCKFTSAFFGDFAEVAKNHKMLFDNRCNVLLQKKNEG